MIEKILIVEDDINLSEVMKIYFEKKGYLVNTAITGENAVKWMEEVDKPDLVLVDIGLPDMSGLEVCRKIKENMKTRKIPIIILTGMEDNSVRIKASLECYANLYLNKPIQFEDLLSAVKTLIKNYHEEKFILKDLYSRKSANPNAAV